MKYPLKMLGEIAGIRTGFTFRGEVRPSPGSGLYMLQIAEIQDSVINDADGMPEIEWPGNSAPTVLQHDDIVMVARGVRNRAAIFKGNIQVVPSNQVMVVVINSREILPDYLCWQLNYSATQKQLAESRGGTNIPSINKNALQAIRIAIPPMEIQKKILAVEALGQSEIKTLKQLQQNTENMLAGMFAQLLNGEQK